MASDSQKVAGPDFTQGYELSALREGKPVLGHAGAEPVLLTLLDDEIRAIGASCTHYGGPLGEGLVVAGTVRCPWHHACFSLRTGEALAAPALNPVPTWAVEIRDGRAWVGAKHEAEPLSSRDRDAGGPERVVIIGAGAAGSAAAEMLRRSGWDGELTMIDPDEDAPYDRPNLSKDFLAGSAPEEWIPLRPPGFYEEHDIRRIVDRAATIDVDRRQVQLGSGESVPYDTLLLATGATPRRLSVAGADLPHVHVLRSLADCRAIIADAKDAEHVVIAGASFIGMEAAASLRARDLHVTVVAPDTLPFERTLGADLGTLLLREHERNGIEFRLGRTLARIEDGRVILDDGSELRADIVIAGIGVAPDVSLAEAAGLAVEDGVLVDEYLKSSDVRIYAAGDIARWPDPRTGRRVRIEHWVVAQRQGQAAARNMLGAGEPYGDVPFFWTKQFDVGVSYVGHAAGQDTIRHERDGDGHAFRYISGDRLLALATIGRDRLSLLTELEMQEDALQRARKQ